MQVKLVAVRIIYRENKSIDCQVMVVDHEKLYGTYSSYLTLTNVRQRIGQRVRQEPYTKLLLDLLK